METRKKENKMERICRNKKDVEKGVNTLKYCGVIKLKENPLTIQKSLSDEWK